MILEESTHGQHAIQVHAPEVDLDAAVDPSTHMNYLHRSRALHDAMVALESKRLLPYLALVATLENLDCHLLLRTVISFQVSLLSSLLIFGRLFDVAHVEVLQGQPIICMHLLPR